MLTRFIGRLLLLSATCGALSHAGTINIGLITFNNTSTTGASTIFNIYNFTSLLNDSEFPVLTNVDFLSPSLEIQYQGQPAPQAVTTPAPILPAYGAYTSNFIPTGHIITRAIFRASLGPATSWALNAGGFFLPHSNQLEVVLLPSNGSFLRPDLESWYLQISNNTTASEIPEPSTFALAVASLLAAMAFRAYRSRKLAGATLTRAPERRRAVDTRASAGHSPLSHSQTACVRHRIANRV